MQTITHTILMTANLHMIRRHIFQEVILKDTALLTSIDQQTRKGNLLIMNALNSVSVGMSSLLSFSPPLCSFSHGSLLETIRLQVMIQDGPHLSNHTWLFKFLANATLSLLPCQEEGWTQHRLCQHGYGWQHHITINSKRAQLQELHLLLCGIFMNGSRTTNMVTLCGCIFLHHIWQLYLLVC